MTRLRTTPVFVAVALCACAAVLVGCATTRQSRHVEESGFLGNYADLEPGGEGDPELFYLRPNVDWSRYDAILIDSVTIWVDSDTEGLSKEDRQRLTDALYERLHAQLSKNWRMAEHPGPGVLRLRGAITEAKGSRVVLDTVTSIVPQARLLTTVAGMAAGTAVLVGKVGVEAEITDSLSGERLMAGVDARQGTKAIRGGIKKWSDVYQAFDFWAERLDKRLVALRAG